MEYESIQFVGGPAHGRTLPVREGVDYWKIFQPAPLKYTTEPPSEMQEGSTHLYKRVKGQMVYVGLT